MSKRQITGEQYSRTITFSRADADEETRTIPVSISSEAPVKRWFGNEVLSHKKSAIDFERAGSDHGLPLRMDHGGRVVGRVKNIRLSSGRLIGNATFSENTKKAREAFADVRDGILTDTSIQYDIIDYDGEPRFSEENGDNTVTVTRWRPIEAAIVGVPADASVGTFRSKDKGTEQMTEKKTDAPTGKKGDDLNIADFNAARANARKEGFEEGSTRAAERVGKIISTYDKYLHLSGVTELRQLCIDENTSAERANELLLELIAGDPQPARSERKQGGGSHAPHADIETVKEAGEKWLEGCQRWLEVKGGLITDRKEIREATRENEFSGMKLDEIARDYVKRSGAAVSGYNRMNLIGQAFVRAGMHGTSDFANLLENVANKALMIGYDENPETWRSIVRIGTLSDFKPASRVNISSFSDLAQVLENGEFKQGHMSDLKEPITLGTYGRLFNISRQAIINDDLSAMTTIPRAMGNAADRNVGDIVWAVVTANAALNQDAVALFHTASHGNLASSGGAISETTLDAGRNAMQTQTSPAPAAGETGATLNIRPALLMVPSALELKATKAVRTPTGPDTAGDLAVNTFYQRVEVISEARLDSDSTTAWYLSANPNMVDTIECAFLDGQQEPFLDSQNGWTIDGVEYKVRHDVAAAAMDYRGLYKNAGA